MDRALMARRLAQATLASRADVARYLEEARRSGKLREVCSWQARLRDLDHRIARYGLQRYAEEL